MAGWKSNPLGEVAHFINGLWKGEEPPFTRVGVIRNTNFTKECALDDSDIAYLDVEVKKFQKRRLQFGDLILEKSGGGPKQPVGRVVLFDKTEGDFSFSNFTAAIRIVDPQALDARFLHKYLHWVYVSGRTEAMQSHSTGIRNLNGDAYKAIEVTYPPLPEQQRLVVILDDAFEAIATAKANTERNLQNAHELFDTHLSHVFSATSDLVPLADLASDITDGDHMPPPKASSGVPFITISNIVKRTRAIDFENTFLVPPEYFARLKPNRKPQRGDVLYTVTGATLGIPVLVDHDAEFCFQRHIALIRPRPGVNSAWLNYLMSSPQVFAQATAGATGAAQKTVSLTLLRSIRVPRHSGPEQIHFAARLDQLFGRTFKLEDLYSRRLAALDELKRALLHQAFTGALTSKSKDLQLEAVV